MKPDVLRQFVGRKPFRPPRFTVHAGEPVVIRHPESIIVRDHWVYIDRGENAPIFFEPAMAASVEFLRNGARRVS